MKFSKIAETLPSSEILSVARRVKDFQQEGHNIHNFTIGDFNPALFPIPFRLEEAIVNAYRGHHTNYPQAEGNLDLREAICEHAQIFQQLSYQPGEIAVASGGRPLIFALYYTLCDPGDTVIYPVPSWNNNYYTRMVSGEAIEIQTKGINNFLPTAEEIEPHIAGATLLALCSPQNPAGTVYTPEELKKICDLVISENERRGPDEKKLYLLYDQLYSHLVYPPAVHCNPVQLNPRMRPYTVTVDAISKSFAATGVRVGWCFGPEELISKMKVFLTHMGAWAPMPEQKGLATFLGRQGDVWAFLNNFKLGLQQRLDLLYKGILSLKAKGHPIDAIAPQAAVFLSVKIDLLGWVTRDGKKLENPDAVTRHLLEQWHIALVPFSAFGATHLPCWYRMSVSSTSPEEIDDMLVNLGEAMNIFRPLRKIIPNDY